MLTAMQIRAHVLSPDDLYMVNILLLEDHLSLGKQRNKALSPDPQQKLSIVPWQM